MRCRMYGYAWSYLVILHVPHLLDRPGEQEADDQQQPHRREDEAHLAGLRGADGNLGSNVLRLVGQRGVQL